jgi:hypothetical protein
MLDPTRFRRAGLFPADVPEFLAGFQRGEQIWVYPQQGEYYTRHLLLHEGTHGFMYQFRGGLAAPWYAEGMAELFGLHQWRDDKLTIGYRLTDRDEVPYWGRVALIRKAVENGELKTLDEVFQIPGKAFRQVESYAWAWAACEFLSRHPLSAEAFADLIHHCADDPATFSRRLPDGLQASWSELEFEWRVFLREIDYGYDVERAVIGLANSTDPSGRKLEIMADRGWQATKLNVHAGQPLTISASGEFQIAYDTEPWPCQANGVTIEYYRGRPLGRLLAAILPITEDSVEYPRELEVIDIGNGATIVPAFTGYLLLRINDSPARWGDNQGLLAVTIE